jgi:hypothetical protein
MSTGKAGFPQPLRFSFEISRGINTVFCLANKSELNKHKVNQVAVFTQANIKMSATDTH